MQSIQKNILFIPKRTKPSFIFFIFNSKMKRILALLD